MLNIGLLGLGVVGIGIVQILEERKDYLEKFIKKEINISKILVKDIEKIRDIEIDRRKLTTDIHEIIEDNSIDVIIEVMGGLDKPYEYIKEALSRGKNVITANKAVVAKYLEELTDLARKNNRLFLYEASVGGGIPIIKPLKEQININEIQEIRGILNGTSNYILTRMVTDDLSFKEALEISQNLGYAEADPTDDIEGYDTRRKLRILSTIAFKDRINEDNISCYGINSINFKDIKNIKNMNCTIKLLGTAVLNNNKYYASVEPVILSQDSYLGKVDNAKNLVSFIGDMVGELRFFGEGAGRFPTANAVLSDLIDITTNTYPKMSLGVNIDLDNMNRLYKGKYYMRIDTRENTEDKIEKYIKENGIIENMIEKKEGIIFTTKSISKEKLERMTDLFKIDKKDYFTARLEV
ncbi:homoserine dehydrogenase [Tissierella sp. MB52-C2]|uniref:homoserine dehydrogenase n=1 Tax=Tissierella sp. MB52-C2 TaxID=3070999 RepID=UPI00280C220B|nr:homoserine dehydrogenase [Tissierella sp. MB52-C2]WMM24950.1 homoserine dehydrogenase [Tissierella sp. MB52-C2]